MRRIPHSVVGLVSVFLLLCSAAPSWSEEEPITISQFLFPLGSGATASTGDDTFSTTSDFSTPIVLSHVGLNDGWINTNASVTPDSEASAVAGSAYFYFTVTPKEDTSISFTKLSFGTAFYASSANAYNVSIFVRSSVDNYATTLGSIFTEAGQSNTLTPSFTPRTIELSDPMFQNLTSAVTFRFYMYDGLTGANRYYGFNDVELEAIPEPSTWLILAGGMGLLALIRRKAT